MISTRSVLWLCMALITAVTFTGCAGCTQDPLVKRKKELEEERKKKEKPKEDFEMKMPRMVPGEESLATPLVKPGHWISVAHQLKANYVDFPAELHTRATDRNERDFFVENTPFQLRSSLPAKLPKGQERRFETTYFVPRSAKGQGSKVGLHRELRAAHGGRLLKKDWQPIFEMPGYQYLMVVLATDPDRYGYLKRLTAIAAPTSDDFDTEAYQYYRVLLPKIERIAPVPSNSLTWSTIAYVVWDDADPNSFTPQQREALLDWLHWGGQIIISGPNSLARLKGSFLEDYLPAHAGDTVELTQESVIPLNDFWSLKNGKTGDLRALQVLPNKPLIGVELLKDPQGEFIENCGELVAERRIGRGRIVATSFSLTQRALLLWGSYDSFFNGALLRKPHRKFSYEDILVHSQYVDYKPGRLRDARLSSTLRYFTRDVGHSSDEGATLLQEEPGEEVVQSEAEILQQQRNYGLDYNQAKARRKNPRVKPGQDDWHFGGYPARDYHGLAAWNDRSGVSDAARKTLKDAAGISIPRGEFVLQVLAIYLVVLAPVNWCLFRVIGRVEWAWLAAPLIALIGAGAVVRMAQLDIGFARSVTEVSIAEVYGGYARAHLTRYTALYTSLSDTYDLAFEDDAALAQPFGMTTDYQRSLHDPIYPVSLRREAEMRLSGFKVASNTTGVVHCEQMVDLGGAIRLQGDDAESPSIINDSDIVLLGVGVIRRTAKGKLQQAWVGELGSKAFADLKFADVEGENERAVFPEWGQAAGSMTYKAQINALLARHDGNGDGVLHRDELAGEPSLFEAFESFDLDNDGFWGPTDLNRWSRSTRAGEVSLGKMIELGQSLWLAPGDARLIGWSDEYIPGMTVWPESAQGKRRTMFLVHLDHGALPKAKPDVNSKYDFVDERPQADLPDGTETDSSASDDDGKSEQESTDNNSGDASTPTLPTTTN